MITRISLISLCLSLGIALLGGAPARADNLEATRSLAFAERLMKDGMARSAAAHFRDFLDEYPNHPRVDEARWGLARAYEALGDTRITAAFRSYIEKHPEGVRIEEAYFGLARAQYSASNWSDARAAFGQFYIRYPNSSLAGDALYYEGLCLIRMDRPLEAVPVFEKAVEKSAGELKAEAAFSAASAYYRAGMNAEAAEALSVVAAGYPESTAAAKAEGLLGDIFFGENQFDVARSHYALSVSANLAYADKIAFWHAYCAIKMGEIETGVLELTAFARNFPQSERAVQALRIAAESAEESGDRATALAARQALLELPSISKEDRSAGLYELGNAHMRAGDFRKAEETLYLLLRDDTTYQAEAEYLLGLVALKEKRYAEAESFLRSAESLSRGSELEVNIIVTRLTLLKIIDNPPEYARLVKRLKKLDVAVMAEVLYHGAELLESEGKTESAAEEYRKIVEQFPGSNEAVSAMYALGMIHYSLAEYDSSEKRFIAFAEAIKGIPAMSAYRDDAEYWIGFSRYQSRRMEEAIVAFIESTRSPDGDKHGPALLRAGDAAFTLKRYDDAVSYYSELIDGEFADSKTKLDAIFNRAIVLRASGRIGEARDEYLHAYADGGANYEEALLKAAECLQDAGEPGKAALEYEAIADRFTALGRKEEALFRAARLREEEMAITKSIQLYRAVSAIGGALAPDALFSEATLLLALGDTPRAEAVFSATVDRHAGTVWGRRARLALARIDPSGKQIETYRAIIDENSEDQVAAGALLELGIAAMNHEEFDTASALIRRAIEIMPEDENLALAKYHLGQIHFSNRDYRQALRHLEYVVYSPLYKNTPLYRKSALLMARTLAARDRIPEALKLLDELELGNADVDFGREINDVRSSISATQVTSG